MGSSRFTPPTLSDRYPLLQLLPWWLDDAPSLSTRAREEIRIKEAIGRLEVPADLETVVAEESFVELPVTVRRAHALAELPPVHRDPFDRMLVAQARSEGFQVVTHDRVFERYEVPIVGA